MSSSEVDPTRRRRRNVALLVAAIVATAAVGAGAGVYLHQRSAHGRSVAVSSGSPSPTPGASGSASPTPSRSPDPAEALGLPRGGGVPAGFVAASATTTARGITYLLGSAPCATPPCGALVRYDGLHWRGVPAPAVAVALKDPSARPGTVRDVRFGTPRDGWAYGGALWSTHDGARNWRPVDVGGAVVDLASDGTTAYAAVSACTGSAGDCRVRLRSTPVGRDDWRDVPGVAAAGSEARLSIGDGTAAVSFVDSRVVYVRHGGAWSAADVPCPDGTPEVVGSASSPRLFAFCGSPGAGSVDYLIRYSDDGRTWTDVPLGTDHLRIPNGPFTSFTAPSSTVLLAASGGPSLGGRVMVSRDGGATWAAASGHGGLPDLDSSQGGGWRYVGASSASRVVALAAVPRDGYWVSHDSGRTWQTITVG
jgi:hypothetical protein